MLKILRIKKTLEFQKISKNCEKFYSHSCLLLMRKTPEIYFQNLDQNKNLKDFCRVGFTVAKTVSKKAVERNLAKRRLRAAFEALAPNLAKNHFDYVVVARREILNADFVKISTDLKFCLSKIHSFKKNPAKEFIKKNDSEKK